MLERTKGKEEDKKQTGYVKSWCYHAGLWPRVVLSYRTQKAKKRTGEVPEKSSFKQPGTLRPTVVTGILWSAGKRTKGRKAKVRSTEIRRKLEKLKLVVHFVNYGNILSVSEQKSHEAYYLDDNWLITGNNWLEERIVPF